MNAQQLRHCLEMPQGPVDAVLDTDAFNEVDDQFAIAYMLRSSNRIHTKAIYAAPFYNSRSVSPADGMEKSFLEIQKLLQLCGREDIEVYRGSEAYLENEKTAIVSPAAEHLAKLAMQYHPEQPLYIIAIGAITNVASALLLNPAIRDRCVVVWLGGHAHHWPDTKEFNLWQDVAAARVVFSCGVPVVQLPCGGIVDHFTVTVPELRQWLVGKNELADYLAENVISCCHDPEKAWSRVIWDVTAVAWLTGDKQKFLLSKIVPALLPDYEGQYDFAHPAQPMAYVYHICRDALMNDLLQKLLAQE
ncbi:MAG: nucleoside hydrolase [Clostridiales bacterium]|nr:MAG: nucleoside hydrolase [Clostridiales bacterium]